MSNKSTTEVPQVRPANKVADSIDAVPITANGSEIDSFPNHVNPGMEIRPVICFEIALRFKN